MNDGKYSDIPQRVAKLRKEGRFEEAIALAENEIEGNFSPERTFNAYMAVANVHLIRFRNYEGEFSDLTRAIDNFSKSFFMRKDSSDAAFVLFDIFIFRGEFDAAMSVLGDNFKVIKDDTANIKHDQMLGLLNRATKLKRIGADAGLFDVAFDFSKKNKILTEDELTDIASLFKKKANDVDFMDMKYISQAEKIKYKEQRMHNNKRMENTNNR